MRVAVMLSIRPKWCELIASGRKTIEVRKTRPKIEPPFVCYIYCTKDTGVRFWTGPRYSYADDHSHNQFDRCGNGKVIGVFVCDEIFEIPAGRVPTDYVLADMRMRGSEFHAYRGKGTVYCWHISDLVIYDKPRDLAGFRKPDGAADPFFKRPPQSWCYVEELDA